jgi:very-short-patch-repair endonuclease
MEAPKRTIVRARELRRQLTPPEARLWIALRQKQLSRHFRRQHPLGPYILDFYCHAAKLAVEVDGEGHLGRVDHDERRDRWLLRQGIRTLRIPALEVRDNLEGVLETIRGLVGAPSAL